MITVTVGADGRLEIPASIRKKLDIDPGDLLVLEGDEGLAVLHLAKAENPFDGLAAHAIEEYRQGRTTSLLDFAKELGIDLDNAQ